MILKPTPKIIKPEKKLNFSKKDHRNSAVKLQSLAKPARFSVQVLDQYSKKYRHNCNKPHMQENCTHLRLLTHRRQPSATSRSYLTHLSLHPKFPSIFKHFKYNVSSYPSISFSKKFPKLGVNTTLNTIFFLTRHYDQTQDCYMYRVLQFWFLNNTNYQMTKVLDGLIRRVNYNTLSYLECFIF